MSELASHTLSSSPSVACSRQLLCTSAVFTRTDYEPLEMLTRSSAGDPIDPLARVNTIVGTADGRVLPFSDEYEYVGGDAHASLVAGLSAGPSGTVHSVGFDDRLREIDGKDYT